MECVTVRMALLAPLGCGAVLDAPSNPTAWQVSGLHSAGCSSCCLGSNIHARYIKRGGAAHMP